MRMRRIEAADAEQLARGAYDSFLAFNESVGIPQRLDFGSPESAIASMKRLSSNPAVHGVVAVEEDSGAIMAAGFITPGLQFCYQMDLDAPASNKMGMVLLMSAP